MNKNSRKAAGKKILGIFLGAAVLMTGFPVQASEFSAPVENEGLFSSGTAGDVYIGLQPNENNTPGTETTPLPSVVTPVPETTPILTGTPEPSVTPAVTETPEPSVTPAVTETPKPSVTPSLTATPAPTISPMPTRAPLEDGKILLRFADADGKYYESLDIIAAKGEELKLPNVPDTPDISSNNGNRWKLEKDKKIDDTFSFDGGEAVTFAEGESWDKYMTDGVLTFYAVKECTVTFYNNSGTGILCTARKAYEGGNVVLPYLENGKYFYYGWTSQKGGKQEQYSMDTEYRVTEDMNLYVVRLTALTVTFLQPGGSSNTAMKALGMTVPKGASITMPEVPDASGYKNLGWSTSKNASKASYAEGKKVKISKNRTFYAVRKKYPYAVTFNNNSGTSTSKTYTKLKIYADKNQAVKLPELPKAAGYQNVGWTTKKKGSSPLYKAGSSVKVSKNMQFYAVRKKSKYYTVNFYLGNGATNAQYKKLAKKVEQGTTITLPSVPARDGYVNLGWSGTKNAAKASSKTTYKVNKNVNFYAVQKKAGQVVLHYYNGDVYSSATVVDGSEYTLPCVKNASGYTFLGWSTSARQSVNPEYEPEEKITVKGKIDLYAVVFDQNTETDITADSLPQANPYKYKKVIFVGDSRTVYMKNTLEAMNAASGYNLTTGLEFICKEGKGYDWLIGTAYPELLRAVGNGSQGPLAKPTVVIFNLGVNDLSNKSDYIGYLNSVMAPILKSKGCELYIMSVNPVNRSMLKASGKGDRSEAELREFNQAMRNSLSESFAYIDTYSYLKSSGYGFSTSKGMPGAAGTDDGLHYTPKTYKRIYAYCMNQL